MCSLGPDSIKAVFFVGCCYAVDVLLANYPDAAFKPEMLSKAAQIRSEEYYVTMMIAWYFSTGLVKQYTAAIHYYRKQAFTALYA